MVEDYLPVEFVKDLKRQTGEDDDEGDSKATAEDGPPRKKKKVCGRTKKRLRHKKNKRAPLEERLCLSILQDTVCAFGDKCKFSHDVVQYLANKQKDLGDRCHLFDTLGKCIYGVACCFGQSHLTADHNNIVNEELWSQSKSHTTVLNTLPKPVQRLLRDKKYDFSIAITVGKLAEENKLEELEKLRLPNSGKDSTESVESENGKTSDPKVELDTENGAKSMDTENDAASAPEENISNIDKMKGVGIEIGADSEGIKFRPKERKTVRRG